MYVDDYELTGGVPRGILSVWRCLFPGKIRSFLAIIRRRLFLANIPSMALRSISSGLMFNWSFAVNSLNPPGYPVCQRYFLSDSFFPVNLISLALIITT